MPSTAQLGIFRINEFLSDIQVVAVFVVVSLQSRYIVWLFHRFLPLPLVSFQNLAYYENEEVVSFLVLVLLVRVRVYMLNCAQFLLWSHSVLNTVQINLRIV